MFALALCALDARADDAAAADVLSYRLGKADEVRVEVVGEEQMSGVYRVNGDCTVELRYAGAVPVCDLTLDEATLAIKGQLARTVLAKPQVLLSMESYNARVVEVSGAVKEQGTYPIKKDRVTVSDMLLAAGGLVELNTPSATIVRRTGERVEVDLLRLRSGDGVEDRALLPGDTLWVPPMESVFVDGQVEKPGAIAFRDGMTLMQAIAQAGSMKSTALKSGVYIMRGSEKLPVNLKKVLKGEEADVKLLPSDRIYVPESVF
ncbi:MAG: SLBB domain-containing protein [Myxococcota bacterium]